MTEPLDPIRLERRVPVPPDEAFRVFTDRIAEWWDPRYSANPATFTGAVLEGRIGGRVFGIHSDLGELDWGTIVEWEPGRRLAWAWTLAQDAAHPSLLQVAFEPDAGGARMRLAHGGWNEGNAAFRRKFRDWPKILDRYVDRVRQVANPEEHCERCDRDVAVGTPLYAHRVTLLSADDPGVAFICLDCRRDDPLHDEDGNALSEAQLEGMKYVIGRGGNA